jgi:hypothetical protein
VQVPRLAAVARLGRFAHGWCLRRWRLTQRQTCPEPHSTRQQQESHGHPQTARPRPQCLADQFPHPHWHRVRRRGKCDPRGRSYQRSRQRRGFVSRPPASARGDNPDGQPLPQQLTSALQPAFSVLVEQPSVGPPTASRPPGGTARAFAVALEPQQLLVQQRQYPTGDLVNGSLLRVPTRGARARRRAAAVRAVCQPVRYAARRLPTDSCIPLGLGARTESGLEHILGILLWPNTATDAEHHGPCCSSSAANEARRGRERRSSRGRTPKLSADGTGRRRRRRDACRRPRRCSPSVGITSHNAWPPASGSPFSPGRPTDSPSCGWRN